MTLTLTTQDNWLEYCALKFQSVNHFMCDLPRELLHVQLKCIKYFSCIFRIGKVRLKINHLC